MGTNPDCSSHTLGVGKSHGAHALRRAKPGGCEPYACVFSLTNQTGQEHDAPCWPTVTHSTPLSHRHSPTHSFGPGQLHFSQTVCGHASGFSVDALRWAQSHPVWEDGQGLPYGCELCRAACPQRTGSDPFDFPAWTWAACPAGAAFVHCIIRL